MLGGLLILIAFLGAPLFTVIAASTLWGFHQEETDLIAVLIEFNRIAEMPVLISIPLFTFAGYLLGESQAPKRLVRLSQALFGWLPASLAIVAIIGCAIFTSFTGASGVTIIALGALLYPAMQQAGYKDKFSLGLLTSSGSLGILFAPSLPLILYAVVAQQMALETPISIDDLFLAGILPGLMMMALLIGWAMFKNPKLKATQPEEKIGIFSAIRESIWEIPLPFLVLGGIYTGYFAVSEAAAVTAGYVLMVEVIILREVKWGQLSKIIHQSMLLVGAILVILGMSMASTNYLIDTDVPVKLFTWIKLHISSTGAFLLSLNIFLLLLGMLLDIFSAIVLVIPLILPVAIQFGVHPVHLGIIFLANMQIGYFTPPVGMNLFIASFRFNKPIIELYLAALPFFFILLFAVLIITYFPQLSLVFIDVAQ